VHFEYVNKHTLVLWDFNAHNWQVPNVLLVVYCMLVFLLLCRLLVHLIYADDLEGLRVASHVGKMLPELT
jgi:hypothetical protein